MPQSKPTLRDIARSLGVSTTTVHRALNGKEGVGDKKIAEIRNAAARMGYKTNYMASALKRREVKIAVAFPEPSADNRYYYLSLWQGIRRFFGEVAEFNAVPEEFYYPLFPGSNGIALKEIYDTQTDEISGLITVAVNDSQSLYFIEAHSNKGIPVVLIGASLSADHRLCCVKSYDELAGSLAAELICAFYPGRFDGKVHLTGNPTGDAAMVDQYYNITGFEQYLAKHAPDATLLTAFNADANVSAKLVQSLLSEHPDTYAIYASSARHTISISHLLESHALAGEIKLIGNDYFAESADFLSKGALTAIIDKKIAQQSYKAAQLLFNYVIKGNYPPAKTVYIETAIILRSGAAYIKSDSNFSEFN